MRFRHLWLAMALGLMAMATAPAQTVARQWNEALLEAIRNDFARPTSHARNLWHTSIAIWDSWAIYDPIADPYLTHESPPDFASRQLAQEETMSYACYRILTARFADSPGADETLPALRNLMINLGYDPDFTSTVGSSAAKLGNRIAINILHYGLNDLSNEQQDYAPNNGYMPINDPLIVASPELTFISWPNHWQPLALATFVDQSGHVIPQQEQSFLGPHWGQLPPFALEQSDLAFPWVYLDPGMPPQLGGTPEEDFEYRDMFTDLVRMQSVMTPDNGIMIDISPAAQGNNPLGTQDGTGHDMNPFTGQPYESQIVPIGDYARCLAEFWADGPDSETPPGHWNTIAHYVTDNTEEKRIGGTGTVVNDLEWDVKLLFVLNGAVYDASVAGWGVKGYYDYVRPISAIRFMSSKGQSSSPELTDSYDPQGILLEPGVVELITVESAAPGQRHEHLADHLGEIAVLGWPGVPASPESEYSGVEWILGIEWLPYQRSTFVTPPFAGYVSGHSTFSRAAAEVLTAFTGSEYFPNGLGEFHCPMNEFLVFEDGPSVDMTLEWATYRDAADESGISRRWGGIHPWADDYPGRVMGEQIGLKSWNRAQQYYSGNAPAVQNTTGFMSH